MATRAIRRRLSGVALAGCLALLMPATTEARPRLDPERQPAVRNLPGGFLAWVGEVFARVWEETGMMIDPDGQPRPGSSSEGETGMMIDRFRFQGSVEENRTKLPLAVAQHSPGASCTRLLGQSATSIRPN